MNNILYDIIENIFSIPGFLFYFTFTGFFQAWVALKLGDSTPKMNGFLSLNPKVHINIIGFICLILFGFGFGKNVPTNSRNYRNIKRDSAIQILSAPIGGLLLSFAMLFLVMLFSTLGGFIHMTVPSFSYNAVAVISAAKEIGTGAVIFNSFLLIFYNACVISIFLTVFFMLPLPGFNGYKLIVNFLPYRYYRTLYNIERYNLYIFIGFLLLIRFYPMLYYVLVGYPSNKILELFLSILTPFFDLFV